MCSGLLGSCNVPSPRTTKRTQRSVNWICSRPRWKDGETQTRSQSLDLVQFQFQKRYKKRVPENLLIIRILQNWTRHNWHNSLSLVSTSSFELMSVLRIWQLTSWPRNSPPFIKPEDSVPRSQKIWLNAGYSNQTNPSTYSETNRTDQLKLCVTYSSTAVAWSIYQPSTAVAWTIYQPSTAAA